MAQDTNDIKEEILRLRGELAAITRVLAWALEFGVHGDAIALGTLRKTIASFPANLPDDVSREGVGDFTNRLLKLLPSNDS